MHRRSFVAVPLVALAVAAVASCGDPVLPTSPATAPPSEARRDVAPGGRTGTWSAVINWPHVPAHMIGLPDGKVITWTSGDLDHSHRTANVHVWDPADPFSHKQVPNNEADVFCAGHSFLPDGNLMVAGGHITVDMGIDEAYLFNSGATRWAKTALNMARGRWYPSTVTLGNGDVLVAAGNDENGLPNPLAEVFEASTGQWRLLEGAPLALPYYPRMHLAPDGRAFIAGPEAQSRWLNPSGSGAWTDGPVIPGGFRSEGTAVMYQPGKLLVFGGNDPATATAYTLDLNVAGATWQQTGSLRYARRHFSVQMLPDGRVLAMGGTGAGNEEGQRVLASEVWDPATGVWTEWAPVSVTRTYHSSAVLLHDGRVLNGGGGRCGEGCPDYANAQIFTPPYLLNADGTAAARPTITSAPASVGYGQSFTVATPQAAAITRVSLVRLPAFTHAIDMNQRFVPLSFTKGTGQLTVSAPTNPNLAPPGHYMMFVLDGAGVPSVAKVVQVTGSAALPALPAPAAPTNLVATAPANTQASLTWSDNSNSETSFRVERCTGAGCTSFAEVATTAPGYASYVNGGLTAGTTYRFRVRAVNSTGPSSYTDVALVTTPTNRATVPVVDRASGKCLDVLGGGVQPNGQDVWLWTCYGGGPVNQAWLVPTAGTSGPVRVYDAKCLDAWTAQGNAGDPIKIYDCIPGAPNQQWTYTTAGELRGINGLCVNLAAGGAAADGSGYLALGACGDAGSRRWNIETPAPPPVDQPPVATFTPACSNLTCTFDSNASSDDRGITARAWTFGDGTSADDGSVGGTAAAPTKTYSAAGTYGVTLTVTDASGQTSSQTKSVTVAAPPVPAPVAPSGLTATAQANARINLAWTDNSTNETAFNVERCEGAGCTAFVKIATVAENVTSYANTGLAAGASYSYRVHSMNGSVASANSNVATARVAVANQAPVAAFTPTCTGLSCTFADGSTDPDGDSTIVKWGWTLGDSTTAAARSPAHTYKAAGTYGVTLTVTDAGGLTNSVTRSVTVTAPNQPPVAAFTASCTDLTCTFANASTDPDGAATITTWAWTFGDSRSSAQASPTHSYAAAGTYSVILTVTDDKGATSSATRTVTATAPANRAPVAAFTPSCTGLSCTFTDGSTDPDGNGTLAKWSWTLGDSTVSAVRSPTHTYKTAGTYGVTLTVTDSAGAASSVTRSVTVTAPNTPPAAAFTVACTGLSCTFTDGSTDADGPISSRRWTFGDAAGGTSTATSPTYGYAAGGTYTVTLTVTDAAGATNAVQKPVTVTAPNRAPVAAFTSSCTNLTCTFTDGTADPDGTVTAWSWTFGDNTGSTLKSPQKSYAAAGTYTVSLTATDNGGATNTVSKTVTVSSAPTAVPVLDRASGKCLDVLGGGVQPNGQDVWLWTCYGGPPVNQAWLVPATGTSGPIRVYGNKCLDAWTALGNAGDPIKIYDCIAGAANQQWTHTSLGELKGINGLCVNLKAGGAASDGSGYLALGACADAGSRRWTVQTTVATK